jgi:hypothetical protein
MRAFYRLKTLPWPFRINTAKRQQGAFTLLTVFMFLLFSTLGLSLIYFSQVYIRLTAYKKHTSLARYASENGVKQELEDIKNLLMASSGSSPLLSTEYEELSQDIQVQGTAVIERLLGKQLPLRHSGGWENLAWNTQTRFYLTRHEQLRDYIKAFYRGDITSTGQLENFETQANSLLETSLQIHAGHLPLPLIPLLIGKDLSAQEKEEYLETSNISLESSPNSILPTEPLASADLIPSTSSDLIENAFKIDIFRPQEMHSSRLRQILGLADSEEDVPPGVYLIQDDLGLGGVFVQGDLDRMILAIEEENQIIIFEQGTETWVLRFNPSLSNTQFITPSESYAYDLIPLGIIIVDGTVASLTGATVDLNGEVTPLAEEEIPCIRQGVNLTILASEEVIITSHLTHQGVSWQDGIPYLKDSQSQLTIFSTGQGLNGEKCETTGISIAAETPSELKIQASITSAEGGFSLEGSDKQIVLSGSLHTSGYAANGNELVLLPDERYAYNSKLLENSPSTRLPLLFVSELRIMAWKEGVEDSS